MFEVGFTELLLIFAIALIVLGPEKLPKLAQQVGRWVGRARAMARQFRDQLDEEAHNLETKMNIDPGLDTSLDPKPKPADAPAPAADASAPATTPPEPEPEEEFYPPDHHMHSSHRDAAPEAESQPAATDTAAVSGTDSLSEAGNGQAEMDLTTPRDVEPRSAP
jgi:sec-independent protein translocase protein TatB